MTTKKIYPFFIAIAVFSIISLVYFYPVLKGKEIKQSDIVQFKGSSKEINDYRKKTGNEPYWTNTSFGGMPAYVVSAKYPHQYIHKLDQALRFLPRPADYLFLYFFGFFILLQVLKIDWKIAVIGALGFGLSTYLIVILSVGHNAKADAIAYFPLVLAGIISVFNKKYLLGFTLTSIAMALEINASHLQMTYYLMFMIGFLILFNVFEAYKNKKIKPFFKEISIIVFAIIIGIGVNATKIMATKQYQKVSTRSASELTTDANGNLIQTSGLDKDYITEYSYGKLETFNLFIPRFMGGASNEKLKENSNTYKFIAKDYGQRQAKSFVESGVPTYWGKQPFVAAPAYIGAIFIFLFVLGLFLIKSKYKKWLVATIIFALLLSYGKNLAFLTDFFINYIPFYNKFRAVSSIQVLIELAIPLLGILALNEIFNKNILKEKKIKALFKTTVITGGIALVFVILGSFIFDFVGQSDRSLDKMITGFSDAVIADRKNMFFKDSLRSLILIIAVSGIIWSLINDKIKKEIGIILIGVLIVFDLFNVDKRYVNESNFVDANIVEKPFTPTKIDKEIQKDKSHYRVLNLAGNPMNEARTSYFHNSIGGYHAAKPRRYQELFERQIVKMNEQTINMLNAKYIIFQDKEGNLTYQKNQDVNGNAWFVNNIYFAENADQEMKILDTLNTKNSAVTSIKNKDKIDSTYPKDSTSIIKLTDKKINEFTYKTFSNKKQFAVFSEMFFKDWQATIDGEKAQIYRVNYVLRGLEIPKGKHTITFKFIPEVVNKGSKITLIFYLLLILIPLLWWFLNNRKK
jgi:hypothetical protein